MTSFAVRYPRVASVGNKVSHAKNRRKRSYKYNLQTVTIVGAGGKKIKMKVPVRLARTLRKKGLRK